MRRAMQQARQGARRRDHGLRRWHGLALLAATSIWEPAAGAAEPDPRVEQAQRAYQECGAAIDNAQYPAAEAACQKTLGMMEALLGPNHKYLASVLNDLAYAYQKQEKYDKAETTLRRALKITEENLGPSHPNVATTLVNLAGLYNAQKKYEAAEPLFLRALKTLEAALGPDHATVIGTIEVLAELYGATKRIDAAIVLYQRALKSKEAAFGKDPFKYFFQSVAGSFVERVLDRRLGRSCVRETRILCVRRVA